ncbi:unnamed protein product [Sphacelaria rigidula]
MTPCGVAYSGYSSPCTPTERSLLACPAHGWCTEPVFGMCWTKMRLSLWRTARCSFCTIPTPEAARRRMWRGMLLTAWRRFSWRTRCPARKRASMHNKQACHLRRRLREP